MRFASPTALWLLTLVLVVLLARRRQARARRMVGNLYLWPELPHDQPLRIAVTRLRRHLLAVIQAALIAALVLTLAGAALEWRPERVGLVIDVSASMAASADGMSRLAEAVGRARAMLADMPANTPVQLVAAGPTPVHAGAYLAADPRLTRRLDDLAATAGRADLEAAIRLLGTDGQVTRLLMYSDAAPDESANSNGGLTWVTVGQSRDNVAIEALTVRRPPGSRDDAEALASLHNYGDHPRDLTLTLTIDGRVVEHRPVHLEANASATLVARLPGAGAGEAVVGARIPPADALAIDDAREALLPADEPIRVRLVTTGSFFLERALAANPDVSLEVVRPGVAAAAAADGIDVLVCDGCPSVPEVNAGVLRVAPPADGATPPALLTLVDVDHHVATAVALESGQSVVVAPGAAVPADATIVLQAGAEAALLAAEGPAGRVVDLRFALDSTTLPTTTAFPILLANVLTWLAERESAPPQAAAGDVLQWTVPTRHAVADVRVVGPDSRAIPVHVVGRRLSVVDTLAAGPYRVEGRGWQHRFVVTAVTGDESDLRQSARSPIVVPPTSAGALAVAGASDTPLGTALIVAALMLLVAEWWYRHRLTSGWRR